MPVQQMVINFAFVSGNGYIIFLAVLLKIGSEGS